MSAHDILYSVAAASALAGVLCLAFAFGLALGGTTAPVPATDTGFQRYITLMLSGVGLLLLALIGAFILHS